MEENNKKILVSIIIPVYRNAEFLKTSLKSCIDQTYKNIEILVVSDGSPEIQKIKEIILKFNFPIRLIVLKKNAGVSNALNVAINKAKGSFINWLSHDDYFDKNKIFIQLNDIIFNGTDGSLCNFYQINKRKKIIKTINIKNNFFPLNEHFLIRDTYNFCTLLIRKKVFSHLGFFDTQKKHTQDYDMFFKIFNNFKISIIKKNLLYSRVHHGQTSVILKSDSIIEKDIFYCSKFKYLSDIFFKVGFLKKIYMLYFLYKKNLKFLTINLNNLIYTNKYAFKIFVLFFIGSYVFFRKKN
jgi:glycosyltransferase involved in cell wall biosynthesis